MLRTTAVTLAVPAALLLGAGAASAYEVEPGDTLSEIAAAHDTNWPSIYKLNDDKIKDPDLIYPGQQLQINGNPKASSNRESQQSRSTGAARSGTVRPATGHVTSEFLGGYRSTGGHSGTDFSGQASDGNAYAAKAGKVTGTEWANGYGRLLTIDHGGGVKTRYAHLAGFNVSVGQRVGAGDVVGRIGSTGNSTGPHLHFEVLIGGDFVDPEGWLE